MALLDEEALQFGKGIQQDILQDFFIITDASVLIMDYFWVC